MSRTSNCRRLAVLGKVRHEMLNKSAVQVLSEDVKLDDLCRRAIERTREDTDEGQYKLLSTIAIEVVGMTKKNGDQVVGITQTIQPSSGQVTLPYLGTALMRFRADGGDMSGRVTVGVRVTSVCRVGGYAQDFVDLDHYGLCCAEADELEADGVASDYGG
jgi:hypothetical protein